jgi:hypothetical protein
VAGDVMAPPVRQSRPPLAEPPSNVPEAASDRPYLMLFLHCVKAQKSFESINLEAPRRKKRRRDPFNRLKGDYTPNITQRVHESGSWPLFMNSASCPSSTMA